MAGPPQFYTWESFLRDRTCLGEVTKYAGHWLEVVTNPERARRADMAKMGILDNWMEPLAAQREAYHRLKELFDHLARWELERERCWPRTRQEFADGLKWLASLPWPGLDDGEEGPYKE